MSEIDRRTALGFAAAAAVGVPLVAACGAAGSNSAPVAKDLGPATIDVKDVPVNGGAIFPDQQLVVTQPIANEFKAFSAVCPHQFCIVSSISQQEIHCGCHGSAFSIVDGSVKVGPATSPLASKTVTVHGAQLTVS